MTSPVVVTQDTDGSMILSDATGVSAAAKPGAHCVVRPSNQGELRVDDTLMPGHVEIRHRVDGEGLDGIVVAPIETYIEGVLAGELISGWPLASFEAQAVAARSYAMHERRRARDRGRAFDVESSTRNQVFVGLSSDVQTRKAVASTRGYVLFDGSRLLRAYYSSCCGGRPSSAGEIWPITRELVFNSARPIQGTPRSCLCQRSPLYRWSRTQNFTEITARFRAWGAMAGHAISKTNTIDAIEVDEVNKAGRPSMYRVTARNGRTYQMSAEEIRNACNTPARSQPAITRETRMPSGDFEATAIRSGFSFRGRGFGHGVGLCQWGAFGMASDGASWREIVALYYPNARLKRLWSEDLMRGEIAATR